MQDHHSDATQSSENGGHADHEEVEEITASSSKKSSRDEVDSLTGIPIHDYCFRVEGEGVVDVFYRDSHQPRPGLGSHLRCISHLPPRGPPRGRCPKTFPSGPDLEIGARRLSHKVPDMLGDAFRGRLQASAASVALHKKNVAITDHGV